MSLLLLCLYPKKTRFLFYDREQHPNGKDRPKKTLGNLQPCVHESPPKACAHTRTNTKYLGNIFNPFPQNPCNPSPCLSFLVLSTTHIRFLLSTLVSNRIPPFAIHDILSVSVLSKQSKHRSITS